MPGWGVRGWDNNSLAITCTCCLTAATSAGTAQLVSCTAAAIQKGEIVPAVTQESHHSNVATECK